MRHGVVGLLIVGLGVLLPAAPVMAHHSMAAKFDDKKPVTLRGLITKVDWLNPHAHLYIHVQNGNAAVSWAIELESPIDRLILGRVAGIAIH